MLFGSPEDGEGDKVRGEGMRREIEEEGEGGNEGKGQRARRIWKFNIPDTFNMCVIPLSFRASWLKAERIDPTYMPLCMYRWGGGGGAVRRGEEDEEGER